MLPTNQRDLKSKEKSLKIQIFQTNWRRSPISASTHLYSALLSCAMIQTKTTQRTLGASLATELPENIGDCSGAGVDRTRLSLWALIGLGKSWARIGLDWLGSAMNLQVLLSWRVRFVPFFLFFFCFWQIQVCRFYDDEICRLSRRRVKTEQEQKIHRTLERKHGEIIGKVMKEPKKHKEIDKENSDGEKKKRIDKNDRSVKRQKK